MVKVLVDRCHLFSAFVYSPRTPSLSHHLMHARNAHPPSPPLSPSIERQMTTTCAPRSRPFRIPFSRVPSHIPRLYAHDIIMLRIYRSITTQETKQTAKAFPLRLTYARTPMKTVTFLSSVLSPTNTHTQLLR